MDIAKPHLSAEDRPQTVGEEWANTISHGLGLIGALVACPLLILAAADTGDSGKVVGASLFGASMILLYLTSTVYHAMPQGRVKSALQVVDHAAIFFFIAGSYMPYTFGPLHGPWRWSIFGVVWALAIVGILLKARCGVRHPRLSMLLYLAMGWTSLVAAYPLWVEMPAGGFLWLLAGGCAYTGGVAYFLRDNAVHYHHFRWHLFVLAGSACHFVSIYCYAI